METPQRIEVGQRWGNYTISHICKGACNYDKQVACASEHVHYAEGGWDVRGTLGSDPDYPFLGYAPGLGPTESDKSGEGRHLELRWDAKGEWRRYPGPKYEHVAGWYGKREVDDAGNVLRSATLIAGTYIDGPPQAPVAGPPAGIALDNCTFATWCKLHEVNDCQVCSRAPVASPAPIPLHGLSRADYGRLVGETRAADGTPLSMLGAIKAKRMEPAPPVEPWIPSDPDGDIPDYFPRRR